MPRFFFDPDKDRLCEVAGNVQVPDGLQVIEVDPTELPQDSDLSDAWEFDNQNRVVINPVKAQQVQRKKRKKRADIKGLFQTFKTDLDLTAWIESVPKLQASFFLIAVNDNDITKAQELYDYIKETLLLPMPQVLQDKLSAEFINYNVEDFTF